MDKIIIVNWKWDEKENAFPKPYDVEHKDTSKKIVVFLNYQKQRSNDIQSFYNEILKWVDKNELLVCCHDNNPNNITDEDLKNLDTEKKIGKVFFHNFKEGGTVEYYDGDSGLLHNDIKKFNDYEKEILIDSKIPGSNFNSVWELCTKVIPLKDQKKKIINLWLPLAIDIQGLSEVQNDTQKAIKYFDEIKKETEYLESLKIFSINNEGENRDFPQWEEIKKKIKNGYKDFDPTILVNEVSTIKDFSAFNIKYFSDPNFLPNWLQEVVRVLDDEIKEQNLASEK